MVTVSFAGTNRGGRSPSPGSTAAGQAPAMGRWRPATCRTAVDPARRAATIAGMDGTPISSPRRVVVLCGGVGGAKLVDGLAQVVDGAQLTVIVNTADDFRHYSLHISPDVDTVIYTLAGRANPVTGWGIASDTRLVMDA